MAIHKAADNSFKLIFDNHTLFSQFIRNFINIDILKEVNPEDIEDLSERFIRPFGSFADRNGFYCCLG